MSHHFSKFILLVLQDVAFRGHVYQIKTEQVGENNSKRGLETIFHIADESGELDGDIFPNIP